jgi:hypothetical protein
MKRRRFFWSKPRIVDLSQLPETLGHCMTGTTGSPSATGPEGHMCHYGDCTGPAASHSCRSGGAANAGCIAGSNAGYFSGSGGCQAGGVVHD